MLLKCFTCELVEKLDFWKSTTDSFINTYSYTDLNKLWFIQISLATYDVVGNFTTISSTAHGPTITINYFSFTVDSSNIRKDIVIKIIANKRSLYDTMILRWSINIRKGVDLSLISVYPIWGPQSFRLNIQLSYRPTCELFLTYLSMKKWVILIKLYKYVQL